MFTLFQTRFHVKKITLGVEVGLTWGESKNSHRWCLYIMFSFHVLSLLLHHPAHSSKIKSTCLPSSMTYEAGNTYVERCSTNTFYVMPVKIINAAMHKNKLVKHKRKHNYIDQTGCLKLTFSQTPFIAN